MGTENLKNNKWAAEIELTDSDKKSKEQVLKDWGFEPSIKKGDQYVLEVTKKKTTKNKILIHLKFKKVNPKL